MHHQRTWLTLKVSRALFVVWHYLHILIHIFILMFFATAGSQEEPSSAKDCLYVAMTTNTIGVSESSSSPLRTLKK